MFAWSEELDRRQIYVWHKALNDSYVGLSKEECAALIRHVRFYLWLEGRKAPVQESQPQIQLMMNT